MSIHTLSIEEVEKEFSSWRDNKNGRIQIPEALCEQIKILLKSHQHSKVLRRLGLSMQQAKNKGLLPIADETESLPSSPFVKVPMTKQPICSVVNEGTTLTLQRGDTKLSLGCPSNEQIQLIINTLLR
jgi:hypothetical protein